MRQIKRLLGRHGFRFSKSMGQNFLIDPTVPQEIAAVSGTGVGVGVLEIGPGIGALTEQLAQRAERVTAIELDGRLLPILEETLKEYDNVSVVNGDVLKLDLPSLAAERFAGLTPVVCANLPYNITTPVLSALLEAKCFRSITVMIQREVARRICAAPRTSDYGAFSLFCQYHASCELLFEVPPESFLPAPKVTSAVVQLRPMGSTARTGRKRGIVFPHGTRLLCHAPQDVVERTGQRVQRTADKGGAVRAHSKLRISPQRPG